MLQENIRKYRKEKNMSQEELAVRLHVVRQTVSKWENGLSVPDADILMQMAELLEVPVSKLLGADSAESSVEALTEELARLNEELTRKTQTERNVRRAGNIRNLILFLSFAAMLGSLLVNKEEISVLIVGVCMMTAAGILYRNLALLTSITTDDMKLRTLRITTIFNIISLAVCILLSILVGLDVVAISEQGEKVFAMLLISCVMLFGGIVSPKLPFTRHTGLRLPWTVRDEDTWNVAHKIFGYISFPLVLLYIAGIWTIDNFELVSSAVVLAWVGIPGVLSYFYYFKKMHGMN